MEKILKTFHQRWVRALVDDGLTQRFEAGTAPRAQPTGTSDLDHRPALIHETVIDTESFFKPVLCNDPDRKRYGKLREKVAGPHPRLVADAASTLRARIKVGQHLHFGKWTFAVGPQHTKRIG